MGNAKQDEDLFKQLNKTNYFVELFKQLLQFCHLALIMMSKSHFLFS